MTTWFEDDDLLRDLPAFIVAVMVHAALISFANFGSGASHLLKPGSKLVSVEVVTALPVRKPAAPPPITVAVAPVPEAKKEGTQQPAPKPGPVVREQIKKPEAKKLVAKRAQDGAKAPAKLKRKPVINRMTAEQLRDLALRKAQARMKAQAIAHARLQAKLVREEELRQAKQRALELAAQRALEARERAAAEAALREERRRAEAERRAAIARAAAEAKAAKARQRAELKSALAAMRDPDEALSDAVADAPGGSAGIVGSPRGRGTREALVPTGDRSDVAAMDAGAEPVYEMEREGFDPIDSAGSGGGSGPDGGGIGWSIDGPAGNRSIIKRVLPESPEWVAKRGLDLSVQIKFQIGPDGRVKPGAVIKRTSGFPEIDARAIEAIKKWKFEALLGKPDAADAWGSVTFKFLMG